MVKGDLDMVKGIAIFGLNGAGKSTLAHALAKETGFFEMDVEDYFFPEQREQRRRALDGGKCQRAVEDLPFSVSRTREEAQRAILEDIRRHPEFILSGVNLNWNDEILSHIGIAFRLEVPLERRLERIRQREERRFGDRVLPGGDMFDQQTAFREMVKNRDSKTLDESAARLTSPVFTIDGEKTLEQKVQEIMNILKERLNMVDSRCGLHCTGCEYKDTCNCGGCIETNGHPFHGECPVAICCQNKGFTHCGECPELPCELLTKYSCDSEHGDTPHGARIEQCRQWAKQ